MVKHILHYGRHKTEIGSKTDLLNLKKELIKLGHDADEIKIKKIRKKIPPVIYAKVLTGYKGRGPYKRKPLYKDPKELQIITIGKKWYKDGYRVYSRYIDRYGVEVLRHPDGKLEMFGEQFG